MGERPDSRLLDRFVDKIQVGVPSSLGTECWVWLGERDQGYGVFRLNEHRRQRAHQFAYEWLSGPIPTGLVIDHLCRNRACVNPKHLEPVTNRENVLRGNGLTAANARKTHCPNGHPYDEENTTYRPNGWRQCRACHLEAGRRYYERNLEKERARSRARHEANR